jgi:hypothetical protein
MSVGRIEVVRPSTALGMSGFGRLQPSAPLIPSAVEGRIEVVQSWGMRS